VVVFPTENTDIDCVGGCLPYWKHWQLF